MEKAKMAEGTNDATDEELEELLFREGNRVRMDPDAGDPPSMWENAGMLGTVLDDEEPGDESIWVELDGFSPGSTRVFVPVRSLVKVDTPKPEWAVGSGKKDKVRIVTVAEDGAERSQFTPRAGRDKTERGEELFGNLGDRVDRDMFHEAIQGGDWIAMVKWAEWICKDTEFNRLGGRPRFVKPPGLFYRVDRPHTVGEREKDPVWILASPPV